jgi:ATP-dependent helicase/nuclease subunit A
MTRRYSTLALDKDSKLKFPEVLLIDASAGSGKTHTLTKRFIQFLLSDCLKRRHNDLTNILAITFTNNAAREMKQRVIDRLKILALDLKTDEEKKEIYKLFSLKPEEVRKRAASFIDTLIDRYADLHVQTIDSFMNRILRSSADELGMPPDNDVTDSYIELLKAAMSILYTKFGTDIPLAEIDAFLDLFNQNQFRFKWNPVNEIHSQFDDFLLVEGRILEDIQFTDGTERAVKAYKEIYEIYEQVKQSGLEDDLREPLKRGLGDGEFSKFNAAEFFKNFSTKHFGLKNKAVPKFIAETDNWELGQRLVERVAELADLISLYKYSPYGMLYQHFKECLETVKRQMRTIHFDDINKRLSRYLRKEIVPEIYYRLGDMLYHFLLDEFQDTAPVQWNNITPLLEEAYAKGGTLFVVGDLKQAIFMFRKADYKIMRNLVKCIKGELGQDCLPPSVEKNAHKIDLKYNFRSGSVILDYVDSLFTKRLKSLMPDILAEDRTGLTTYTQKPQKDKEGYGYVKTMIIAEDEDEVPEKQILIDIVKDAKQRYSLSEIAILAHENKHVESIVSWLTEEKIPAASFSSLDIRKRKIVMEICSLLQFLDTPIDDLSFASFLTGNVFLKAARATDPDIERQGLFDLIAEKKQQQRGGYLYTYFRDHTQYDALWRKYFDNLFKIVGYYPLYDLVSEVYKTFGVFANFPKEAGFLVQFLEAVSALESQGKGSIKDLTDLAGEEMKSSILEIVLPDYVDAVKAMTFHKAKGLGFDVVVNYFNKDEKGPGNMFFDRKDGNLYARYITVKMCESNTHLKAIYDEAKLDGRIERLNLTYVAVTRARHELYNLIIRKDQKKVSQPKVLDLFEDQESGTKEEPAPAKEHPPYTCVSMPEAPSYPQKKEEDMNWSVERLVESRKGDLFHRVLADIEYLDDTGADAISASISRAMQIERLQYDPADIQDALMKFLELPEVRQWFEKKDGRKVLRECEFVNQEGRVYRMDRVVVDQDRVILIDFKTGSPLPFYAKQMENYTRMLEKVYPGKPIACFHAYVDSGRIESS